MEYRVWVDLRGGYYTTIEANNPDEAMDLAIADADPFECMEWDIDADVEVCDNEEGEDEDEDD